MDLFGDLLLVELMQESGACSKSKARVQGSRGALVVEAGADVTMVCPGRSALLMQANLVESVRNPGESWLRKEITSSRWLASPSRALGWEKGGKL